MSCKLLLHLEIGFRLLPSSCAVELLLLLKRAKALGVQSHLCLLLAHGPALLEQGYGWFVL